MKINIENITASTSTNLDGDILFSYLSENAVIKSVVLEITGDRILSSSFLNSSFGKFIDIFGLETFRKNIRITTNRNIFNQLKKYVDSYSDLVD